jgi:molybdenum-dependent DNA-binding transcriptional regulator ModE
MSVNTDQKIIKNKVGVLKLAEMLGSVSQACKMMGYSTAFTGSRNCMRRAVSWR